MATEKKVECSCEDWGKYVPIIDGALSVGVHHSHLVEAYPADGLFRFCPWCGKSLQVKPTTSGVPTGDVWAGRGRRV